MSKLISTTKNARETVDDFASGSITIPEIQRDVVYNPYSCNNTNALKRAFGAACRRANIKGFRFHNLRHTAATRMVESGANIVAVSRILGYADLKTTIRYSHSEDSLKDVVEKLGNFALNSSQNRIQQESD
jgi:integrase